MIKLGIFILGYITGFLAVALPLSYGGEKDVEH